MESQQQYTVLGLHGDDVTTVDKIVETVDANNNPVQTVEQRNVARVRMFVGDQMIDEDFTLPKPITIEEQIDTAVKTRMAEIVANGTDPAKSQVIPEQTEQIVAPIPMGEGEINV